MASVRIESGAEQQNISRATSVKQRPMLLPLKTDDGAQCRPHPVESDFEAVNRHLLAAKDAIEISQTKVLDRQAVLVSLQQAVQQEQKLRSDCSDAYQQLYSQQGQLLMDLHNTSTKCGSLNQQLQGAQGAISDLELTIRELEKEKANTAQQQKRQLANAANRIRNAEQKIIDLEKKREKAIQEHEIQGVNTANFIGAAQQKIDQLEKGRECMMQEHQSAMADAAGHIATAEQKIRGLEKKCSILETHELSDSAENNASPKIRRRQRPDNESETSSQSQSGPATRGRKRRSVATPNGEGTIVVSV